MRNINRDSIKQNALIFLGLLFISLFYAVLYKIYIPRVNAFGCFDDCSNFLGGYFLLNGKHIFTDFFFNHLPFAANTSALIQTATKPEGIYELVLRHRQFILLLSFLMALLTFLRFRLPGLLFVFIFELTKFYFFGDRFLSEAMIVYPLAYLFGLNIYKLFNLKIFRIDYVAAALIPWFTIFSREPYVPLSLFLLFVFMYGPLTRIKKLSFALFIGISAITLFMFNIQEMYFNVVTVNLEAVLPAEKQTLMWGPNIFQSFFYPLYIPFYGSLSIIKDLLLGLTAVFLTLLITLLRRKKFQLATFIFITLGLANLRVVIPGSMFYEAFHMLIWYAILLFSTFLLLFKLHVKQTLFPRILQIILLLTFGYVFLSPSYFIYEKVDPHVEFITNYGVYLQEGEVIKMLSNKNDTLFLDGSDDLTYWQAGLFSPYKYSWYTSAMPLFKKYTDARIEMFKTNPPTFYREYGSCPKDIPASEKYRLPDFITEDYVQLENSGKPSCIFIRKDKIPTISEEKWNQAENSFFSLPEKN